jgi:cytochrome c biogenesis protein CcmG/thiol:disulfide interchange protein DsbE
MIDPAVTGSEESGIAGRDEGATASTAGHPPPRSRTVLYTSLAAAVVIAVLVAVLAFAKPGSNGTSTNALVGHPAPPVSGPALSGSASYSLSMYSGKWVVLNFSASWCVPCVQETPQLEDFYGEHARTGDAVILAVAFDSTDISHLAAFLASKGAKWPAVNDPSAEVAYGVSEIPQTFLISPSGVVAAKFFGAVTAAELDHYIAQSSGSGST